MRFFGWLYIDVGAWRMTHNFRLLLKDCLSLDKYSYNSLEAWLGKCDSEVIEYPDFYVDFVNDFISLGAKRYFCADRAQQMVFGHRFNLAMLIAILLCYIRDRYFNRFVEITEIRISSGMYYAGIRMLTEYSDLMIYFVGDSVQSLMENILNFSIENSKV